MCCKCDVKPLVLDVALAVLAVGQFTPTHPEAEQPLVWRRSIPEEGCYVSVNLANQSFEASIQPSINNVAGHHGKRVTAGVYFEIAAKYAEKVGGEIRQRATVEGCRPPGGASDGLLLAAYPSLPMQWANVCNGFRAEILNGGEL